MRVWEMVEFARIVFIDADAWVVGDVSDLCRRTEDIAALGSLDGGALCTLSVRSICR